MDRVLMLRRAERLYMLVIRATTRSTEALLDLDRPALEAGARYTIHRDRANRLREAYWQAWHDAAGAR